jgi:hypothetical protein
LEAWDCPEEDSGSAPEPRCRGAIIEDVLSMRSNLASSLNALPICDPCELRGGIPPGHATRALRETAPRPAVIFHLRSVTLARPEDPLRRTLEFLHLKPPVLAWPGTPLRCPVKFHLKPGVLVSPRILPSCRVNFHPRPAALMWSGIPRRWWVEFGLRPTVPVRVEDRLGCRVKFHLELGVFA